MKYSVKEIYENLKSFESDYQGSSCLIYKSFKGFNCNLVCPLVYSKNECLVTRSQVENNKEDYLKLLVKHFPNIILD